MKRRLLAPLILALLIGGLAPLAAEDGLTLGQARTLALAQSKTLQKALAAVDAAKIDERLQAFTLLPSLSASASGKVGVPWTSLTDSLSASVGVSVTQTVFDGGAYVLTAIDTLSTSIAQAAARAEYFTVLDASDTAYYAAAKAAASVDSAQSDLDSALAAENLAKAKKDAGMISSVAYMEQEATVASKQASLVSAQGTLSVATRTLASLTGLSMPLTLAPMDTASSDALMKRVAALSDAQTESFIAAVAAAAEKNNPSITEAQLTSTKAQKTVDYARAGYYPTVSASVSGSLSLSGDLSSSLAISASVPLDVWNTMATVDSKKAAAKQAVLGLEETRRTTTISIQQAVYDCISSAKSVASSQAALVYAERYYQNVQEQYKLSAASAADLSSAALLVSTDRASLISARYAFLSNLSTLRSLAGFETDDLLVQLVP